jgi:hypothetical protein
MAEEFGFDKVQLAADATFPPVDLLAVRASSWSAIEDISSI